MAKFVGSFASGHAPNIPRAWDALTSKTRDWLETHFDELGRRIRAVEPDVLVIQTNDHWINFFLDNLPAFSVGVGEEHDGPPEPFMKPVFPYETIPGHPALGQHILQTAFDSDFDPAVTHRVKLDHGACTPLWRIGYEALIPVVPVFINLMEPPFPSPKRCIAWGKMLRRAIESYPEDIRVALIGTGGLSHSIGETTMGWIDEPFDHACIELFRNASDDEFATKLDEMLRHTGNGGAELRNWLIAHAAAGSKGFDLIGYTPMPEALIGCGLAEWKVAA